VKALVPILGLSIAAGAWSQETKPGDLVPIEQGTADTSATQTTLRVMPVELNESTNFLRLYGVAGRPDLLVRSHGGMYAVFDQGQYVSWRGASLPVWPSGTQFFIGRPDFSRVKAPGIRMDAENTMLPAPGIRAAERRGNPDQPDARVPDTRAPVPEQRLPDARLAGSRLPDGRLQERHAKQTPAPQPTVKEAHAVPPDSRRLEPVATPNKPTP
jgi:hypothetical protein